MSKSVDALNIDIPPPDPVYPYQINSDCPIVIDLGSFRTHAGWASEPLPYLSFHTMVGRGKVGGEMRDIVGNDLEHISVPSKSPFNFDVPYHFGSIEAITDHIFGHLGLSGQSFVPHPVVITEPVCNTRHARTCMTELMFECYGVPKLTYGIDALFSYWYHKRNDIDSLLSSSALILRSGYKTTHILPVINGNLSHSILRINVGGHQCTTLLQQILHLNYPQHQVSITYNVAEHLKEKYAYTAYNYQEELKAWQDVIRGTQKESTDEMSNLKTTTVRLPHVVQRFETQIQASDEQKSQTTTTTPTGSSSSTSTTPTTSSTSATPSQNREDRIMRMRQMVQKRKEQKNKENDASKKREVELRETEERADEERLEDEIKADPDKWLAKIQQQRSDLQQRIEQKKKLSASRVHGRQTVQSIARMKALTEVDADHEIEDWSIYLQLSGDVISEGREEEKLHRLNVLLQRYFPQQSDAEYLSLRPESTSSLLCSKTGHEYHFSLTSCKCRIGEVIFQPYAFIGISQVGVAEAIELTLQNLNQYTPDLVFNTYITGGNFGFRGMKERIQRELTEITPMGTPINVAVASDPVLDAWRGAANFANTQYFHDTAFNNQQYLECGIEYLLENYRHFSLFS